MTIIKWIVLLFLTLLLTNPMWNSLLNQQRPAQVQTTDDGLCCVAGLDCCTRSPK